MTKKEASEKITTLLANLNEVRVLKEKLPLIKEWTGLAHWLRTDRADYRSVGGTFTSDLEFIGFLRGLYVSEQEL